VEGAFLPLVAEALEEQVAVVVEVALSYPPKEHHSSFSPPKQYGQKLTE